MFDAATIQNHSVQESTRHFSVEMISVSALARAYLGSWLLTRFQLDGPKVAPVIKNQKLLRRLPALWSSALQDAGLKNALDGFRQTVEAQTESALTILEGIRQETKGRLPALPAPQSERAISVALAASVASELRQQMESATVGLVTRTALIAGGLTFASLLNQLDRAARLACARTSSLAQTAIQAAFRRALGLGFDRMQARVTFPLVYRYVHASDTKDSRPFCEAQLARKNPLTKAQIEALDNGTGMDVWTMGGGFRCLCFFAVDVPAFLIADS